MVVGDVANNYRAGIVSRRSAAESDRDVLSALLDVVLRAFEGGAWVGGRAGDVSLELTDMRQRAAALAQEADDVFAEAVTAQPTTVPEGSWQARWPWS
jgi:hypothetical protein